MRVDCKEGRLGRQAFYSLVSKRTWAAHPGVELTRIASAPHHSACPLSSRTKKRERGKEREREGRKVVGEIVVLLLLLLLLLWRSWTSFSTGIRRRRIWKAYQPFDDKLFGENLAGFEIFQFRCGIETLNKLSEKELVKLETILALLNCSFKFSNFYLENFIIFIFIFIQYWWIKISIGIINARISLDKLTLNDEINSSCII